MIIAWVVGSTGLLGSALCRKLCAKDTELFSPPERFRWSSELELGPQLAATVQAFAVRVGTTGARWEIYWAAGVGTMSSSEADLALETRVLSLFLNQVESEPRLMNTPGTFAFASSAGAIYAGSPDYIINENSSPAPTTAYAREKLGQEDLVRSFVLINRQKAALLARLSTLYGPGQSVSKQQGLLAHIARCILRNQPIQIYVPFDTIRDYIATDDAATAMVTALRTACDKPGIITKIIASEQPTTIAEIISVFKRITRRTPRIITCASRLSNIYSRRVRFQSVVALERTRAPRISLLVGISQVMASERSAFVRNTFEVIR